MTETSIRSFTHNPDCYLTTPQDTTTKFAVAKNIIQNNSDVLASKLEILELSNTEPILELDFSYQIIVEAMKFLHYPVWASAPHEIIDNSFYRLIVPLAHMYNIKSLLNFCEKGLIETAKLDEELLAFADKYHLEVLINACIDNIAKEVDAPTSEAEKILETCSKKTLIELEKQRRVEMNRRIEPIKKFVKNFEFYCELYATREYTGSTYDLRRKVNEMMKEYENEITNLSRKRKHADDEKSDKKQRLN